MKIVAEKLPPTLDKRCGTYAGYRAHQKRKENLCSDCSIARSVRNREYREKNIIKARAYARVYRAKNIEKDKASSNAWRLANRERGIATQKAWHEKNKERRDATNKAWRLANPERVKTTARRLSKKYRLANPERSGVYCRTRRARRRAAPSEPYTAQDILDRWGTNCHNCNQPIDLSAPRRSGLSGWEQGLHLDHVIPLALGGSDLMINVKPSHGLCNLRKSKTTTNLAY